MFVKGERSGQLSVVSFQFSVTAVSNGPPHGGHRRRVGHKVSHRPTPTVTVLQSQRVCTFTREIGHHLWRIRDADTVLPCLYGKYKVFSYSQNKTCVIAIAGQVSDVQRLY
jgi:hypothetical protein